MEPHSLTYSWCSVPNSCPSLFTALPLHKAGRQQRGSGDSSSFSGQLAQELRCCHPHLTAKQRGVRWAGPCSCKARLSLSLKLTTSTWRFCSGRHKWSLPLVFGCGCSRGWVPSSSLHVRVAAVPRARWALNKHRAAGRTPQLLCAWGCTKAGRALYELNSLGGGKQYKYQSSCFPCVNPSVFRPGVSFCGPCVFVLCVFGGVGELSSVVPGVFLSSLHPDTCIEAAHHFLKGNVASPPSSFSPFLP